MWCKQVEAANWQGQDPRGRGDFHKLFHSSCEDRQTGSIRTTVTDLIDPTMPTFSTLKAPAAGTAITRKEGRLIVPDDPIIPFIEGDGTGPDIWRPASASSTPQSRPSTARSGSSGSRCQPGKAKDQFGEWLPNDTLEAVRTYKVAIKVRSRRRWAGDSQPQRHAAPGARSVCLRPPGAIFHGHACPGDASRADERRDLP